MSTTVIAKRASVGLLAAVALAACGGGAAAAPYPSGPWAAADQSTFMGRCDADASDAFCKCALADVMKSYPHSTDLPGGIVESGRNAAEYKNYFPKCEGK